MDKENNKSIEKIEYLKPQDGGDILDIACGTGSFSEILQSSFGSYQSITGVDVEKKFEKEFYDCLGREKAQFVSGDIRHFLEKDRIFNTLSLSFSLHHIPGIKELLKKAVQKLASGGLLIVREMYMTGFNPSQEAGNLLHAFAAKLDRTAGKYHRVIYTEPEILDILDSTGLEVIHSFKTPYPDEIEQKKETLEKYINNIRDRMEKLKGPDYEKHNSELEKISEAVFKNGISTAPLITSILR